MRIFIGCTVSLSKTEKAPPALRPEGLPYIGERRYVASSTTAVVARELANAMQKVGLPNSWEPHVTTVA
jgi:hypothetical protein